MDQQHPYSVHDDRSFRALLEAAPDAMIIANGAGEIVLANGHAEALFGYARHELIGRQVELLIPPEFAATHVAQRQAFSASPRRRLMSSGLELYARRKDGSEFPVEIGLSPLETPGGVLVVSAVRDISDRKSAEAERARLLQDRAAQAEASRVKDEFIATLSHELRTPLNAILGWASLLQGGSLPPDKAEKAIATILRNARAQIQLVEDLLDVSRIVAGKLTLRPRPIDFTETVEAAVEVIRPAAAAKLLQLDVQFDNRPLFTFGDPDRLQQVAWNLLHNAVKFSHEHGRVQVRAWSAEGTLHLIVRDTGQGIEPRFLPHVFDRFRQADSSQTREHGGLGLGLALVKSIVELHGGEVVVSSSGPGTGAAFRVTIPAGLTTGPFASEVAPAVDTQRLQRLRILVVDDQADERELLATILTSHGADVRTAGSADEAYETIQADRPHVLVTDIAMPGGDGYMLLRRVRTLSGCQKLPAVAVTAHGRVEDRDHAEAAGFDAYLAKPIDPQRLIAVIAGLPNLEKRDVEGSGSG